MINTLLCLVTFPFYDSNPLSKNESIWNYISCLYIYMNGSQSKWLTLQHKLNTFSSPSMNQAHRLLWYTVWRYSWSICYTTTILNRTFESINKKKCFVIFLTLRFCNDVDNTDGLYHLLQLLFDFHLYVNTDHCVISVLSKNESRECWFYKKIMSCNSSHRP